jgi:hypothetical protein
VTFVHAEHQPRGALAESSRAVAVERRVSTSDVATLRQTRFGEEEIVAAVALNVFRNYFNLVPAPRSTLPSRERATRCWPAPDRNVSTLARVYVAGGEHDPVASSHHPVVAALLGVAMMATGTVKLGGEARQMAAFSRWACRRGPERSSAHQERGIRRQRDEPPVGRSSAPSRFRVTA